MISSLSTLSFLVFGRWSHNATKPQGKIVLFSLFRYLDHVVGMTSYSVMTHHISKTTKVWTATGRPTRGFSLEWFCFPVNGNDPSVTPERGASAAHWCRRGGSSAQDKFHFSPFMVLRSPFPNNFLFTDTARRPRGRLRFQSNSNVWRVFTWLHTKHTGSLGRQLLLHRSWHHQRNLSSLESCELIFE